ncbi:MAG: heat-inducible transcriptional repressor HrcA [Simkaniaceae bacterium]|nr:heat-inducible transcriptional repressor HrcA [Simkaniaceae bacterium]
MRRLDNRVANRSENRKAEREKRILFRLIDRYLETGKPVSSKELKDYISEEVSSATIRNYFAHLETQGYLVQRHTSGGRVPTSSAYRLYAAHALRNMQVDPSQIAYFQKFMDQDSKEPTSYLHRAADLLGNVAEIAVFLSAPRFDRDAIADMKIITGDFSGYLCVIVTDFGLVRTEMLHTSEKLSRFALARIEKYFRYRLKQGEKPPLSEREERVATRLYNELFLRHITSYSHFAEHDVYKTGFSHLLRFSELQDATLLAQTLAVFEDMPYMCHFLQECIRSETIRFAIGEGADGKAVDTSIIAIPYAIQGRTVGAVALLGPTRIPYGKLFGLLRAFSEVIGTALTRNLCKHRITYRMPDTKRIPVRQDAPVYLNQTERLLLEDQSLRRNCDA